MGTNISVTKISFSRPLEKRLKIIEEQNIVTPLCCLNLMMKQTLFLLYEQMYLKSRKAVEKVTAVTTFI